MKAELAKRSPLRGMPHLRIDSGNYLPNPRRTDSRKIDTNSTSQIETSMHVEDNYKRSETFMMDIDDFQNSESEDGQSIPLERETKEEEQTSMQLDGISKERQKSTPNISEPYIGQRFETSEEAFDFYRNYAKNNGFSIRKNGGHKGRNERFVCCKQGITKVKVISPGQLATVSRTRITTIKRTDCKSALHIALGKSSKWTITHYVSEHNHKLHSPQSRHFMRINRRVTDAKIALMSQYSQANVKPCIQKRIFQTQTGGDLSKIGCLPKDLDNKRRDQREELKGHDAEMLMFYFESEKEKNPAFHYVVDKNEDETFSRCFWTDARSRKLYAYFGDCIVMDATYKTNKYHLIFVTIAGVNHHRQTVVFGSALIENETADTYKWLLQQWIESMPTKTHPSVIITDQDAALRIAIADVFPNSFHRLCIWHIMNKFTKKVSPEFSSAYIKEFNRIVYHSDSVEEFKTKWMKAVTEAKVSENVWLKGMFSRRQNWVPAYCKKYFSAGMQSSQRIESTHSFFKKYVSLTNSLLDFIVQYAMALHNQRNNELQSDFEDADSEPWLQTMYPIEKEMSRRYTKKNFRRFQSELLFSQTYIKQVVIDDSEDCLKLYVSTGEVSDKMKEITYNKKTDLAKCSCQKFEFEGIPCRHLLFFYRTKERSSIPNHYILTRWTKTAKEYRIWDVEKEITDTVTDALINRHLGLSELSQTLTEEACLTEESTDMVTKELIMLIEKVKQMRLAENTNSATNENRRRSEFNIKDPNKVTTKGSVVATRYKERSEVDATKIFKVCQYCEEQGHNVRTCEKLKAAKLAEKLALEKEETERKMAERLALEKEEAVRNARGKKKVQIRRNS